MTRRPRIDVAEDFQHLDALQRATLLELSRAAIVLSPDAPNAGPLAALVARGLAFRRYNRVTITPKGVEVADRVA